MQATLAELAALTGGQLIEAEGAAGTALIAGAASIYEAEPSQITFLDKAENSRALLKCRATAVVCPRGMAPHGFAAIQVDDVRRSFAAIVKHFKPPRKHSRVGVSPLAHIGATAVLGADVDIHPFATVGEGVTIGARTTIHAGVHLQDGCQIGDDVIIFPNAVLYEDTVVGARTIIHANAVIGAYGFGYEFVEGRHVLSDQLGNVVIGSDVEIGAGTTIDRGTYNRTTIGDGTKIDNQVMVAHNCHIGKHNMLCSQTGIAGSSSTGDYVVMAGQVGVRDHVHIGARSVVAAMSGIANDVPDGSRLLGIPARPEKEAKIQFAMISKLPEMRQQLKKLQRTVDELTAKEALALENAELEMAKRPAA